MDESKKYTLEYTEWLENMVIMLAKCYEETSDILFSKAIKGESNIYLEVPKIQGINMLVAVNRISKKNKKKETITREELQKYVDRLMN